MRRAWLLAAMLASACGPALAQAGAACVAGGTLAQVNACAVRDFQAADTALGVRYGDVMQGLPAHARQQLRREHSGWIQQRNAACKRATREAEALPDGPRRYHECLTHTTRQRAQALAGWQPAPR